MDKVKRRILCLDGGGIKGLFAATILSEIEALTGSPIYRYFDMISGTSTGAIIAAGEGYLEDANVICKVLVKLPPLMSAFEVGTTFFNPRSLTENHYLTFGHNSLQYLKNYPFFTWFSISFNFCCNCDEWVIL